MFEEFNNTAVTPRVCHIISKMIPIAAGTPNDSCLRFWLHMKTDRQDEFVVSTTDAAGASTVRDRTVGGIAQPWLRKSITYPGAAQVRRRPVNLNPVYVICY